MADQWVSSDGRTTFTLVQQSASAQDLVVSRRTAAGAASLAGTITVKNWVNGQLGISLDMGSAPSTPPSNVLTGGFVKATNGSGGYLLANGNYVSAGADPNAPDLLFASAAAHELRGGAGNDGLLGGSGSDLMFGDEGADMMLGGFGRDLMYGGSGDDFIHGSGAYVGFMAPTTAAAANPSAGGAELARGFGWVVYDPPGLDGNGLNTYVSNIFTGQYAEDEGDYIEGGAGNDRITAGTGNDVVSGGTDNDDIWGLDGADVLFGDQGDDRISGDGLLPATYLSHTPIARHGDDLILGGAGNDAIEGQGGNDLLYGGEDNDRLYGESQSNGPSDIHWIPAEHHGDDYLDGGAGDDQLTGGGGSDELIGGAGADFIDGDDVPERLHGTYHGNDRISAGDGDDTVVAGGRDDWVDGGLGNDILVGDDEVHATTSAHGSDTIRGGGGNDIIHGDYEEAPAPAPGADDVLYGDAGSDILFGGGGNDFIDGGSDADDLYGGAGSDTLVGGSGADYLEGGDGDDVYVFEAGDSAAGPLGELDTVVDSGGVNLVVLRGANATNTEVAAIASGLAIGWGADSGVILAGATTGGPGAPSNRFELADGSSYSLQQLVGAFSIAPITSVDAAGNRVVMGGRNSDPLTTNGPNQTIAGGRGNDSLGLFGGGGSTVLFNAGDGLDTVNPLPGTMQPNTLVLGPDVAPTDLRLRVTMEGANATTGFPGNQRAYIGIGSGEGLRSGLTAQQLLDIAGPFASFQFSDGTALTWDQVKSRRIAVDLPAASGGVLFGTSYGDEVVGDSQERHFELGEGDELATAGKGNEFFGLGRGSDTLVLDRGFGKDRVNLKRDAGDTSGTDVIRFGNSLDVSAVRMYRAGEDLLIRVTGSSDELTVLHFFTRTTGVQIEFSSGLVLTPATVTLAPSSELASESSDAFSLTPGADYFDALAGNDQVNGLGGNDTLVGGAGRDSLTGGEGNDLIIGGTDNDSLNGEEGNDTLEGGAGNDYLFGGTGDNTYVFGRGDGEDRINSYDTTAGKINTLLFKAGVSPHDIVVSRGGPMATDAVVRIENSQDSIRIESFAVSTNSPASATGRAHSAVQQFVFADGTTWNTATLVRQFLTGGSGNDFIRGFVQADSIQGGDGNDTLEGIGGNDTLRGGAGNDLLIGDVNNDLIEGGAGNDVVRAGGGVNTIQFGRGDGEDLVEYESGVGADGTIAFKPGIAPSQVMVRLVNDSQNTLWPGALTALELSIEGTTDRITVNNFTGPYLDRVVQRVTFADGTSWNAAQILDKQLLGSPLDDNLSGTTGPDFMRGRAGNDWLGGDSGNDTMQGDDGNDELFGDGGNDSLLGGAGSDSLYGGDGDDTLDGGAGDDDLNGSAGFDTFWFGRGDGSDRIQSGSPDGFGTLRIKAGISASDLQLRRVYDPNWEQDAALEITVAGGTDRVLVSGFFANDDPNNADNPVKAIQFASGQVWDLAGIVARSSPTYVNQAPVLATPIPDATVQEMVPFSFDVPPGSFSDPNPGDWLSYSAKLQDGSPLPSWLSFDPAARRFSGTTPLAMLTQTTIQVTATDEYGATVSDVLAISVSTQNLTLTGTSSANSLAGRSGNDRLNGLAGNDTLVGYAGNDTLDGGTGNDSMLGGVGNDTYLVGSAADVVVEGVAEGIDTVSASVSYTLAVNVENLTLTGSGAINGTGNALDNVLSGNSGANVLTGGAGDDRYIVGAGDTVVENANEGTDSVESSATFVLGNNLEVLTLTGTAAINGTGNALPNVLTGNAGANVLDGGTGSDTMVGGAGNDTYMVNSTGDVVTEAASGGTDLVMSSIAYALGAEVENLTLIGTAAVSGIGNAMANRLTGNAGANLLDGGAGNDTMDGGSGNDTMLGGAGDDTYVVDATGDVVNELAGEGVDLVNSSVTNTLAVNVENLTLTGTSAINGTGNVLDNLLTGNTANNSLTGGAGNDTLDGG
ncbi:MAG: calcium-binding protein, partial [Prochlorococcaceae cyanobacterium]